jgi:meiotically up-regulated gene 157 (Mug157) protein
MQGMTRRAMLRKGAATGAALAVQIQAPQLWAQYTPADLRKRPAAAQRRFTSEAVERAIAKTKAAIHDPQLATIFENCFPNTLDTTVFPGEFEGKPDTFVITGDIDAMWLRDSSAQVTPYLPFAKEDPKLARLIEGVIRRQARLVTLDPYANSFMRSADAKPLSWSVHDRTEMKPGVGERKWEIDSLCYTVRLTYSYWKALGDTKPFDENWHTAARTIVKTFREQQRKDGPGPYHFQRQEWNPTDTLTGNGYGTEVRANGMIFSMFRPSDDACVYPLFVPANLFAVRSLLQLAEMAKSIVHDEGLAQDATRLADEVAAAIAKHGVMEHAGFGTIYAYEIDGYGNALFMDDANAPGLLSLALLECIRVDDPLYQRTRKFALSESNPYFYKGTAAEGIGGPHVGANYIWPMSIIVRGLTSRDTAEMEQCLRWLRNTTAGTNFMHEAFWKDDAAKFTRPWFAWANTLFGEFVLKLHAEHPELLARSYA